MKTYNVILNFPSVIKLTTILGLCAGILLIPIWFAFSIIQSDPRVQVELTDYLQLLIAAPLQGVVLGFLTGLIGYPLYKVLLNKTGGINLKGSYNEPKQ